MGAAERQGHRKHLAGLEPAATQMATETGTDRAQIRHGARPSPTQESAAEFPKTAKERPKTNIRTPKEPAENPAKTLRFCPSAPLRSASRTRALDGPSDGYCHRPCSGSSVRSDTFRSDLRLGSRVGIASFSSAMNLPVARSLMVTDPSEISAPA